MGTWGAGNFDDDTAADHLSGITGKLLADVKAAMEGPPVELEADEFWGVAVPCNLELLALLAEQRFVGVMLPTVETVAVWKKKFLSAWDGSIDSLEPSPGFKKERRAKLEATFARLAKVSRREPSPPPKKTAPAKKKRSAKKTSAKRSGKNG